MKKNLWSTMFAAKRRASDKALLAALEREIVNEEKFRAGGRQRPTIELPIDKTAERERIAAAFGRPLH